jgi:hypothetical protein
LDKMTTALTTAKLLDLLFQALEDWYPDTNELIRTMTDEERLGIDKLFNGIMKNDTSGRNKEDIYDNVQAGKLAEYAISRRLRELGYQVDQNDETVNKESWWDLRVVIDGIGYLLEVKTQRERSESIRFVQTGKDAPVFTSHWNRVHALIVLIPCGEFRPAAMGHGKCFGLWGVFDPSVVSGYGPYIAKLGHRNGVQILIDRLPLHFARITNSPEPGIRG